MMSQPQKETAETRVRKILIERILRTEYDHAQAEFDRARENPPDALDIQAFGQRYIEATVRLRKFLAEGDVPRDVMEKVERGVEGLS